MKRLTNEEEIVVSVLMSVESHIEKIILNIPKWTLARVVFNFGLELCLTMYINVLWVKTP